MQREYIQDLFHNCANALMKKKMKKAAARNTPPIDIAVISNVVIPNNPFNI